MVPREFQFDDLRSAPIVVDAIYRGGTKRNANGGDAFQNDPLPSLLGVKSQGGIRQRGKIEGRWPYVALKSTGMEIDWPDRVDFSTGHYTYFGDNRSVGHDLLDRDGNRLLDEVFEHLRSGRRDRVPPFLIFQSTGTARDLRFIGVAAPGHPNLSPTEVLVPKWYFSREGRRFQNYEAHFTIMDMPVPREWLTDLGAGRFDSSACPQAWRRWVQWGTYAPLRANPVQQVRSRAAQLPRPGTEEMKILDAIHAHFSANPFRFERFAGDAFGWHRPDLVGEIDYTRPYRDGGRDAVGRVTAGIGEPTLVAEYALEAKCYEPSAGCGVSEIHRLAGRLRHRMFGVFVTTSYVSEQAYTEVRLEDRHPIVILSGLDLVEILRRKGFVSAEQVSRWLEQQFPVN